jgi:hypothetical protein
MANVKVYTKTEGAEVVVPGYGTATFTQGVEMPEQEAAGVLFELRLQIRRDPDPVDE